MANLKEIRTRITSVQSTQQVTSAMKMVSAAKLRKAQDAITHMRPYANKLYEVLTHIRGALDDAGQNQYLNQRSEKKILLVLVASNRGLCGAFNTNVMKKAIEVSNDNYPEQFAQKNVDFFVVGKKVAEILLSRGYSVWASRHELYDALTYENVAKVVQELMTLFTNGEYDKIDIVYNGFKNAATQILTVEQFLPVHIPECEGAVKQDFIFEPNRNYVTNILIPKTLKTMFYKIMLDSNAAEHGARMTAMHKATDNAGDLIKELKLTYNKARQASITKEILEIVGGSEALT